MVRMENFYKSWQKVLEYTNEKLKTYNISLIITPEDNTFNMEIHYSNSVETYASGYYEDELKELILDAYDYVMQTENNDYD